MRWRRNKAKPEEPLSHAPTEEQRQRFVRFLALLEKNGRVLKLMSDMEEKSRGEYLFDINYILNVLKEMRVAIEDIINSMVFIGGDSYRALVDSYHRINARIDAILPWNRRVQKDGYIRPLKGVGREDYPSVGGKSANLGELHSVLKLPVPDGFAVTGWAYNRFIEANDLQSRISRKIAAVNYHSIHDLNQISDEIRELVSSSDVPEDLADAIRTGYEEISGGHKRVRVALRSSAIGEDGLHSFAGQYDTLLNVKPEHIINQYREIIASKFTPRAIYYFLSHAFTETNLAMGVCCMAMVDTFAGGVMYSRDPIHPDDDRIVIHSVFGIGETLVDGNISPDVFHVSRTDLTVKTSQVSEKRIRLVLRPDGGVLEEDVPIEERKKPSLTNDYLRELAGYAIRLEEHFGEPQDIEWAVDREGKVYILQNRPLKVLEMPDPENEPDTSSLSILREGGVSVCPGAGSGPIFHVRQVEGRLEEVPEGVVLFSCSQTPELITTLEHIHALVTETGGVASHLATLTREYGVPSVAGVEGLENITDGTVVTVDSTNCVIYEGAHDELVRARNVDPFLSDIPVMQTLKNVLRQITPLNMVDPGESGFRLEACRTFHDITRFAHQKSVEELFRQVTGSTSRGWSGSYLKTNVPLKVNIILLDNDPSAQRGVVEETDIPSMPMQAFWNGVRQQGWQHRARIHFERPMEKKFYVRATSRSSEEYSETSFAVLRRDYMLLSLRMGFHFMTVEALAANDSDQSYIKLQHKGGGASLERRIRRIKLITVILNRMGFEHSSASDMLDTSFSHYDPQVIYKRLYLLGRLTMMTKQLDMALTNDRISEWYTLDFMKQLGFEPDPEEPG